MAVLRMSPNFYQRSEILFKLGMIFAKTNQIEDAINYFQNSILSNTFIPKRKVETLLKIGILHEERDDLAQAQKSYEAAFHLEEGNYKIYLHLAWCYYKQGNYHVAIDFAKKADQKSPGNAETFYVCARIYDAIEKHEGSHQHYHLAISKEPQNATYWCSIAILYYKKTQASFLIVLTAAAVRGGVRGPAQDHRSHPHGCGGIAL